MRDDMLEALYRKKEIILNSTFEEFKSSSLAENVVRLYGDYERFERGFYTVKNHPNIDISKTLFYPKIHKASELFSDMIIAHDGVGNANQAKVPSGYLFMWDHTNDGPVRQIIESVPKRKSFKQAYLKPSFEQATYEETGGWFVGVRNYHLYERDNVVTGKKEWLVIGQDPTGFHERWFAVINEWDVKLSNQV